MTGAVDVDGWGEYGGGQGSTGDAATAPGDGARTPTY